MGLFVTSHTAVHASGLFANVSDHIVLLRTGSKIIYFDHADDLSGRKGNSLWHK